MPVIILIEPLIRQYIGSVFLLRDSIGISGWDEDDRIRDRQPCFDQRVYYLPDNGKGIPVALPLPCTLNCPNLFLKI